LRAARPSGSEPGESPEGLHPRRSRHIHPVHFEHINPFGHYRFDTRRGPAKGRLRPLRLATYTSRAIAATNATATNA
jgi:hypothetical protein